MTAIAKKSVALVLGLSIAAAAYASYRNRVMDHLSAEAAEDPHFFRSTHDSLDAVRKLSTFRGRRATGMLLDIALGEGLSFGGDTQSAAIHALRERGDPSIAAALANLLQPHQALDVRKAAASALVGLPCKTDCARSVLHYLERVARGEPNYEDTILRPQAFSDVRSGLQTEQRSVYNDLDSVLHRNTLDALTVLVQTYGLGGDDPAPFALEVLSRLKLQEACPLLLRSSRAVQALPAESYARPRLELQNTMTSLQCK